MCFYFVSDLFVEVITMIVDRSKRSFLKCLCIFTAFVYRPVLSHTLNLENSDIEFVIVKGWILKSTDLQ